jgi:hypothetical protein
MPKICPATGPDPELPNTHISMLQYTEPMQIFYAGCVETQYVNKPGLTNAVWHVSSVPGNHVND